MTKQWIGQHQLRFVSCLLLIETVFSFDYLASRRTIAQKNGPKGNGWFGVRVALRVMRHERKQQAFQMSNSASFHLSVGDMGKKRQRKYARQNISKQCETSDMGRNQRYCCHQATPAIVTRCQPAGKLSLVNKTSDQSMRKKYQIKVKNRRKKSNEKKIRTFFFSSLYFFLSATTNPIIIEAVLAPALCLPIGPFHHVWVNDCGRSAVSANIIQP